jgi:tRNA pseudouridine38-40 synthase
MRAALAPLAGRHDFKAFQAAGSRVSGTERSLRAASLLVTPWTGLFGEEAAAEPAPGAARLLTFVFEADGFLRHMVRNLVGTLIEVGQGRRRAGDTGRLLAGRDRRRAGPTAPPEGLVLERVTHGHGPVRGATAD